MPKPPPAKTLLARPLEQVRAATLGLLYRGPLSDVLLKGPLPDRLVVKPTLPLRGSLEDARRLLAGRFVFGGESVVCEDGESPWDAKAPSRSWSRELHGFTWLRHLQAAGGEASKSLARRLAAGWVARYGRFEPFSWSPGVLGARVLSWLRHERFLIEDADAVSRSAFMVNLARQARFLIRQSATAPEGPDRLVVALALVYVSLCLEDERGRLAEALARLERALAETILSDGCDRSRDPLRQVHVLLDLAAVRDDLGRAGIGTPGAIDDTLARMATALRLFRHTDGGLAGFNGGGDLEEGLVDQALAQVPGAKSAPAALPDAGYQRLAARRTAVVMDCGTAPPAAFGATAHAGCLSFEMSTQRSRVIVNCGPGGRVGPDWRRVCRATAAHSTLTIGERSSAAMSGAEPERRLSGPPTVTVRRVEADGSQLVEASHDGYAATHGVIHHRSLFLDPDGADLRGEDRLVPASGHDRAGRPEAPFALRFHLHPSTRASLSPNGAILIKTAHGEGWVMRANPGVLTLEESVYVGDAERPRRSEQIVLIGLTEGGRARVNWALKRVARPAKDAPADSTGADGIGFDEMPANNSAAADPD